MANTRKRSRGNGEGSIYFSEAKKKWIAQYTIGTSDSGKQQRKTFYADTRKAVKLKLEEYIKQGEAEQRKNETATITSIVTESYNYKYKINIISANTYGRAKETTKRISSHRIGLMPIQKITDKDLFDFFSSITHYSNSVIKKIYGQINFAFNYGVNNNILNRNLLADKTKFPVPKSDKPTKKIRALTVDEQKRLVEALKSCPTINCKTQILMSLFSGMRIGEINALLLSDVDMSTQTITVNKTLTRDEHYKTVVENSTKTYAGIRTIYMNDILYNVLRDYFDNYYVDNEIGILFYHNDKVNYVSTNAINSQFKRIVAKYKITDDNVNAHMLRHTFATRSIEAGVPAKTIQKMLGHADVTITLNTYCDVFEKFEAENNNRLTDYLSRENIVF